MNRLRGLWRGWRYTVVVLRDIRFTETAQCSACGDSLSNTRGPWRRSLVGGLFTTCRQCGNHEFWLPFEPDTDDEGFKTKMHERFMRWYAGGVKEGKAL